jgi:hypothetical protein
MTSETEDRHGQSVLELPQRRSTYTSPDQAGDRRPAWDAGGDAAKMPAPLCRNDGAGRRR